MNPNSPFADQFPKAFFLEEKPSPVFTQLLIANRWISPDEEVRSVLKPGEGNMNVVVRVATDRQTFIVKQARPWVQKYPQVPAPMERIEVEARFYEQIAGDATLGKFSPKLIGFDADNYLLALEDLGSGTDFTFAYQPRLTISSNDLASLMEFLSALHAIRMSDEATTFPENRAMRSLNHEHIFSFPFRQDTGFDLDSVEPGLQALSLPYKTNSALTDKVTQLGQIYLQPGATLIHGDYYPGSWLKTTSGTRVIDPEFGFLGRPEFDLGVMLAHLKLARQEESLAKQALNQYRPTGDLEPALLQGFMGVEILRRLIGLAQLPLSLDLAQKKTLLDEAADMVLSA
ncbi:phosphotransferase [Spirosoma fluminis]